MDFEINYDELQKSLLEQLNDNGCDNTEVGTALPSLSTKKKKKKKEEKWQSRQAKRIMKEERNDMKTAIETKSQITDKKSKRPPPVVVVFEEPGKLREKEKNNVISEKQQFKRSKINMKPNIKEEVDLREVAREVKEFGASGFSRTDKINFEQEKVKSLGGKARKRKHVPYPLAIQAAKERKEKEIEQQIMERGMGITTKKRQNKEKRTLQPRDHGRWVDTSKNLDTSVGKYKSGVLRLSKLDVRKINNSNKRKRK